MKALKLYTPVYYRGRRTDIMPHHRYEVVAVGSLGVVIQLEGQPDSEEIEVDGDELVLIEAQP